MIDQTPKLIAEPVSAGNWSLLEDLFGRAGASNGCWCMYPRMGPEYRRRPREENKCALRDLARSSPSPGLLVVDGDIAVGWCQVAPRADLAWLDGRPMFRTGASSNTWAIGCFYVRRSHRHLGVTNLLIDAALEFAAEAGAAEVEAYPVDTGVSGHTTNLFPGVASTLASHGFEVVARAKRDRPVMAKRDLDVGVGTQRPRGRSG